MDPAHPSPAVVAGGLIVLVVAFAAREVAAGALRAAGKDLWAWTKRRAGPRRRAPSDR